MVDVDVHVKAVAGALHEVNRRLRDAHRAGVTVQVRFCREDIHAVFTEDDEILNPEGNQRATVQAELTVMARAEVGPMQVAGDAAPRGRSLDDATDAEWSAYEASRRRELEQLARIRAEEKRAALPQPLEHHVVYQAPAPEIGAPKPAWCAEMAENIRREIER